MSGLQWGWCEQEIQQELPDLSLVWLSFSPRLPLTGPSPEAVRARLASLASRWRGARAVNVRQEPITAAYRVLFRHIGLDPEVKRTPLEALALERMVDGGFPPKDALSDVLRVVIADTGVPVWALDADTLSGPLGIRLSREQEPFGDGVDPLGLDAGQLLVADADRALGLLFGELSPTHRPGAGTRKLALFSLRAAGVPRLYVEEALEMGAQLLEGG